jgi:hypothetical protein
MMKVILGIEVWQTVAVFASWNSHTQLDLWGL